jgi:branched-chain amino acid aminotransferase
MLRAKGQEVEERRIEIDEIVAAYDAGELKEVFGSGTAAVAVDVEAIRYKDRIMTLQPSSNSLAQQLKQQLNDIRKGTSEDHFGWTVPVFQTANV